MKTIVALLTIFMVKNVMSIETLDYDVIRKDRRIEIRQYKEHITASVTFETKEELDRLGFRTLADYIFGNNISMTSPVLTKGEKIAMTTPVLSGETNSSWTMSFSMPQKYTLETLPTPNNNKVIIEKVPAKKFAAIRFSGFMSDKNYSRYDNVLRLWLKENNVSIAGGTIRAGYNPPWTLPFLRRNEVLIQIK